MLSGCIHPEDGYIALELIVGMRFQVLFHSPLPGFFSPFPHGTGSLSVDGEYLALEDGPPRFGQGSPCPDLLGIRRESQGHSFRLRGFHPLWRGIPTTSAKNSLRLRPVRTRPTVCPATPYTQRVRPLTRIGFGLFRVRSPLLAESRLISFPPATEMFQFAGLASILTDGCHGFTMAGCPIRRSPDHSLFGSSPRLIAAYHVLHRLPSPRHPPHALSSLGSYHVL